MFHVLIILLHKFGSQKQAESNTEGFSVSANATVAIFRVNINCEGKSKFLYMSQLSGRFLLDRMQIISFVHSRLHSHSPPILSHIRLQYSSDPPRTTLVIMLGNLEPRTFEPCGVFPKARIVAFMNCS